MWIRFRFHFQAVTNANHLTNWASIPTNYVPPEASHTTNADNATFVTTATITNKTYASNIVSGGQITVDALATNTAAANQVLTATSASSAAWQTPTGGSSSLLSSGEIWDDFFGIPSIARTFGPFGLFYTWTSGAMGNTSYANHPGVQVLSTSTSATGSASARSSLTAFDFGSGNYTNEWMLMVPVVSDDTENFVIRCGFFDDPDFPAANGAYFTYNHSTNSGAWTAACAGSSSRTYASTGLSVAAGSWVKLRVALSSGTAYFFTNGVFATTITGGNVPASGEKAGLCIVITKYAGTTARTVEQDYTWLSYTVTR